MKFAIVIPILAATVLLAQTPPPPAAGQGAQAGRAREELKSVLGLTTARSSNCRLRQEERQALQPVRQEMQQAQKALREAMAAGTPDPAAIGQLTLQLRDSSPAGATDQPDLPRPRSRPAQTTSRRPRCRPFNAMQRLQRMRPAIAAPLP